MSTVTLSCARQLSPSQTKSYRSVSVPLSSSLSRGAFVFIIEKNKTVIGLCRRRWCRSSLLRLRQQKYSYLSSSHCASNNRGSSTSKSRRSTSTPKQKVIDRCRRRCRLSLVFVIVKILSTLSSVSLVAPSSSSSKQKLLFVVVALGAGLTPK